MTCNSSSRFIETLFIIAEKCKQATCLSIDEWVNKLKHIYIIGILFSHKNKLSTDTCYNMDEPKKYYSKWGKPDTKGYIFYDYIYMKYLEKSHS